MDNHYVDIIDTKLADVIKKVVHGIFIDLLQLILQRL